MLLAHAFRAGEVRNVSVPVGIAAKSEGYREIISVAEGAKEEKSGWSSFLDQLKGAGHRRERVVAAMIGEDEMRLDR